MPRPTDVGHPRRSGRRAAAVLTLAVALVGGPALRAAADNPFPGQDDVRRAQQHTADVAARVKAIQAQLKVSAQRVDAANTALSEAAEDYDEAQEQLKEAAKTADTAQNVAKAATKKLDGAQEQVGQLAAQAYRTGGRLSNLDVLLSPQGPEDVLERASMVHVLAGQQQQTVHLADSARVVANSLEAQAAQALERRQAAARKLAAAKQVAQRRAATAASALASDTAQKNKALTELAAARRTSIAVERAREEGLRKAAEERAAAAARAEAAQRAADAQRAAEQNGPQNGPQDGGSGSAGGSGSSFGGSGGSSAVAWVRARLGLPYLWGGDGPGSYDCSGLVMRAWEQVGVNLPHSSRMQYTQVEHISYSSLRPGDLIFYATDTGNPETIHHVTMYVGGGMMIEAPYTGANVRLVPVRMPGAMPYAGRP